MRTIALVDVVELDEHGAGRDHENSWVHSLVNHFGAVDLLDSLKGHFCAAAVCFEEIESGCTVVASVFLEILGCHISHSTVVDHDWVVALPEDESSAAQSSILDDRLLLLCQFNALGGKSETTLNEVRL